MMISPARDDALGAVARELEEPRSYFVGVTPRHRFTPTNVLLFCRQSLAGHTYPTAHYRHMLIVAIRCAGYVAIDDRVVSLPESHMVLLTPHQLHRYPNPSEGLVWLFITFEIDGADLGSCRNRPIPLAEDISAELHRLTTAFLAGPSEALTVCNSLGWILGKIWERSDAVSPVNKDEHPSDRRLEVVRQISQYVHANVARSPALATIAQHCGLSTSHMRALFRQQMGMSIGRYVRRAKLYRAGALMIESEMTVGEVAAACGYESQFTFSHAFKSEFGCSPRQYRQRARTRQSVK